MLVIGPDGSVHVARRLAGGGEAGAPGGGARAGKAGAGADAGGAADRAGHQGAEPPAASAAAAPAASPPARDAPVRRHGGAADWGAAALVAGIAASRGAGAAAAEAGRPTYDVGRLHGRGASEAARGQDARGDRAGPLVHSLAVAAPPRAQAGQRPAAAEAGRGSPGLRPHRAWWWARGGGGSGGGAADGSGGAGGGGPGRVPRVSLLARLGLGERQQQGSRSGDLPAA